MNNKLINILKLDEGYSRLPYNDSRGILTIAHGRNLRDVGIDEEEAEYLLGRDIEKARKALAKSIPVLWAKLSNEVKDALTLMGFQLGVPGLLKFKNMLAALEQGNMERAALEIENSSWNKQTPNRVKRVAAIFRTGGI